ncbi:autoinducer binding domain-containing protein [Salmonella enterica]|nr:autoinducer binding domain-containing protein [Salmonella enterica]EHR1671011.1 autoinducer binding domain-containing protein [Salmonella enterica]EIE9498683.1 autoinducer binding domain-containing protein [Salmonella enterica]EIQ5377779.1 autoinducer binding domain-containing protein [Salmonella enterica]ELF4899942.1 autoinducer binding domain-containing protein [Salmonella enterica]
MFLTEHNKAGSPYCSERFIRLLIVIDNYHDEWREVYDRKKLWCLDPVVSI